MLRKLLSHREIIYVTLTGLAWVATVVARFILLRVQATPNEWLWWIICNNLMVAGFAYQLGLLSFNRERKWRNRFRRTKTSEKTCEK